MSKGKRITKKTVFTTQPYRSIIRLLAEYPRGLEQKHLRYLFIWNHDNLHPYTILTIERELRDKLPYLHKTDIFQMKRITSRYNLNKFLNRLLKLHIIVRVYGRKVPVYKLNEIFSREADRIQNKETIDKYNLMNIEPSLHETNKIILYGYLQSLPDHKKREVKYHLRKIEEEFNEIQSICFQHAKKVFVSKFKQKLHAGKIDYHKYIDLFLKFQIDKSNFNLDDIKDNETRERFYKLLKGRYLDKMNKTYRPVALSIFPNIIVNLWEAINSEREDV